MKKKNIFLAIAAFIFMVSLYIIIDYQIKPKAKVGDDGFTGAAEIGGPFVMENVNGGEFTEKNLLGKISLIYFGFTFCPDVCPLAISNISEALQPLIGAEKLQAIFVTLDPNRDNSTQIKQYLSNFKYPIIGLRGDVAKTQEMLKAYKVFSQKIDGKSPEDYLMDHSSFIYVIGEKGQYLAHFAHKTESNIIFNEIKKFLMPNSNFKQ